MGSKRLSWISLVLSIIALVVGVIALVNRCPTQDLYSHFDYMGVIVGILALLVTALIGAQVGQYVFVDRKIEKISRAITRTIARKVAQEESNRVASAVSEKEAKAIAKMTAMDIVGGLPDDIAAIFKGKDLMSQASQSAMVADMMDAIDEIIKGIEEFQRCNTRSLSQSAIDDALADLKTCFEYCKNNGGLRIHKGNKSYYETILQKTKSELTSECLAFIEKAVERESDFDDELSTQDINKEFEDAKNKVEDEIKSK